MGDCMVGIILCLIRLLRKLDVHVAISFESHMVGDTESGTIHKNEIIFYPAVIMLYRIYKVCTLLYVASYEYYLFGTAVQFDPRSLIVLLTLMLFFHHCCSKV